MDSMSRIILRKSIRVGIAVNDIYSAVNMERAETLADYVRRVRNEKHLSLSDVQKASGNRIANSYVSRIENGIADAAGISSKKLQALAKGLQVSEDEIFAVARGISLDEAETFDSEIRVAFKGFDELSDEDKRELLSTVRMLGNEIQRRRPRKPAKDARGKNGKDRK